LIILHFEKFSLKNIVITSIMSDMQINGIPIPKLRVVDLKNELESRGLSKSGKKDELIARLISYIEVEEMPAKKVTNDREEEHASEADTPKSEKEEVQAEKLVQQEEAIPIEKSDKEITEKNKEITGKNNLEEKTDNLESVGTSSLDESKNSTKEELIENERKIEKNSTEDSEFSNVVEKSNILKQKSKHEDGDVDKDCTEINGDKGSVLEEVNNVEKQSDDMQEESASGMKNIETESNDPGTESSETKLSSCKEDENTADDTLVMEIDQSDMVAEEVPKEESEGQLISAEPGQVTSLRKLGGSKAGSDVNRKRGWGATKTSTASNNSLTISSNSLKDLVPDIKPLLDKETVIEEEVEECSVDSDADVAGPKIPDNVKKETEPVKKKKRVPVMDANETNVILITNLTRPFTVNQLKEMLKRTGTIVDFWICRIKTMCCVQFSSVDQASETKMALDGVTWPQGNPKTLRVSFSSVEELKKYQESSDDGSQKLGGDNLGRLGGVREWDKNKLDQEQERAKERAKRLAREKERREGQERERSVDKKSAPVKSLEDLFKKTVAGPAIYWKPLNEEQIKQKIEAKNKKMMEAQIMKEMMDTKESLQRSKRLLPARSPHD